MVGTLQNQLADDRTKLTKNIVISVLEQRPHNNEIPIDQSRNCSYPAEANFLYATQYHVTLCQNEANQGK